MNKHAISKAKAKNRRYRNNNPKDRWEAIKFRFKKWWRKDDI